MKELFMLLLEDLKYHGDITCANLYKGGKFASLQFETEDHIYQISITKEEHPNEN